MKRLTLLLLAVATAFVAACGGTSSESGGGGGDALSLVAYSTPKEAYEEIIPAFQKTEAGADVKFSQSYGSSGEQSRAVQGGLPADVVALSLAPDVDKLVDKGLVAKDWNKDQYDGFVTTSVVVFAVRKGNPKNIKTWDDLTKPGVEVITPNPFTSGGAKWNVMAAYGSQIQQGKSEAEAEDYLKRLFGNVAVQDKSAREALQTFTSGKGDVLIAYENEAITAQQKGEDVDYVVPDETILIENPIAVHRGREGGRQGVRRLRPQRRGAEDLRREGLPVDQPGARRREALPEAAAGSSRSTSSAAGRRSTTSSSIPRGSSERSSRTLASLPASAATGATPHRPTPPATRGRRRRAVPERDRAAAARGGDGQVVRGRARRVLGAGHPAAGGRGAQADARRSRWP